MNKIIELEDIRISITELKRKTEPKPLDCNYWKFTVKNISNSNISSAIFEFKSSEKEITRHKWGKSTINLEPNETVEFTITPSTKKYLYTLSAIYIKKNDTTDKVYDQKIELGKRKEIIPIWYSVFWYSIYASILWTLYKYFFDT
ncbi:MAG: hypothetical protein AB8B65_09725 [Kordia sp.]|uniref:hypothetical protein n=1 Tax=Kordia sp. TaxID=1965332 RepID=UPI00385DB980